MANGQSFAVFDIDGTLIRWQLYHALADELARQGLLDKAAFEAVRQARMDWKERSGQDSFGTYEQTLITLIDAAISSIKVADLHKACRAVIAEYRDQVYTYTRDLIRELRDKNYLIFTISASQIDIVQMLAEYYKFDDFGGSIYETDGEYFTGEKTLLVRDQKPRYLKQLVERNHASWEGSIAVGDSESDIAMLEVVEQPIAFNPTKKLFEHATKERWPIVLERKNMVYQLEPGADGYALEA